MNWLFAWLTAKRDARIAREAAAMLEEARVKADESINWLRASKADEAATIAREMDDLYREKRRLSDEIAGLEGELLRLKVRRAKIAP